MPDDPEISESPVSLYRREFCGELALSARSTAENLTNAAEGADDRRQAFAQHCAFLLLQEIVKDLRDQHFLTVWAYLVSIHEHLAKPETYAMAEGIWQQAADRLQPALARPVYRVILEAKNTIRSLLEDEAEIPDEAASGITLVSGGAEAIIKGLAFETRDGDPRVMEEYLRSDTGFNLARRMWEKMTHESPNLRRWPIFLQVLRLAYARLRAQQRDEKRKDRDAAQREDDA
jgi:hypothetical protein